MNIKINLISDKTKNSLKIKSFLQKRFKFSSLLKSKVIIVVGGDEVMLQTLKKYYKFKKPFYGINSGNYGFLMNKFSKDKFIKNLNNSKAVSINPLEMTVKNKQNQIKKHIAINEISTIRQGRQAAIVSIKNGNKFVIK